MSEQLSLPTGTWKIYGNEQHGDLIISSVDGYGKLKGTAYGSEITGSFNWSSGQIHFVRQVKPNLPDWEAYTGYMSIVGTNVDASQYLLAGFYVSGKHLPSLRHHFGWYATPTQVIPQYIELDIPYNNICDTLQGKIWQIDVCHQIQIQMQQMEKSGLPMFGDKFPNA